jgi:hypothetical protein
VSNWAGEWYDILHSKMSYRSPALTGDLTLLNGEVTAISQDDPTGQPVATVNVVMTNQKEEVLASGDAEIRLPTETLPRPVEAID